jgi:hypothetical protein
MLVSGLQHYSINVVPDQGLAASSNDVLHVVLFSKRMSTTEDVLTQRQVFLM